MLYWVVTHIINEMNELLIEQVKPIVQDGIEFYVSADQKESGMSVRGLARFCGVSPSSVVTLLQNLDKGVFGKRGAGTLEPFTGKAYSAFVKGQSDNGENSAKVVPADTCEAVTFYYAFEAQTSEESKKVAASSYRKFAKHGIHKFILQAVGCIERNNESELLSLIQEVLTEVKELRAVSTEYKAIREKTTTFMPGADDLLNSLSEIQPEQLTLTDGSMSLEGWLANKGVTLSKPQFRRLAQIVCETYRSLVKEDPCKAKFVTNGVPKYNVSVFKPEHFPILQIGLNKLLA